MRAAWLTDDELLERACEVIEGLSRGKDWAAHGTIINEESVRRGYGNLVEHPSVRQFEINCCGVMVIAGTNIAW